MQMQILVNVKQQLDHAGRQPLQTPACDLFGLQHQVQDMGKHDDCHCAEATAAQFEVACRVGRMPFWATFQFRDTDCCRPCPDANL